MQEKFAPLSRVRYLDSGAGNEVFLFLHGGGDPPEKYLPALDLLSRKFRVIAPDLRTKNFPAQEQYAALLNRFLAELEIDCCHLFGNSLSGGIAIVCAALYPRRVDSLVLASSVGIPLKLTYYLSMWSRTKNESGEHLKSQEPNQKNAFVRLAKFLWGVSKEWDRYGWIYRIGKRRDLRQFMYKIPERIRYNTLILHGKKDQVVPEYASAEMATMLWGSKLVTLNGGHGYVAGAPEFWVPTVLDWFNQRT